MTPYYNYTSFHMDCRNLAASLLLHPTEFSGIYGIPRGGCVVAVELSHLLNLPLVGWQNKEGTLCFSHSVTEPHKVLVVDDVIDSGKTRSRFPTLPFACLHVKEHSSYMVEGRTFAAHWECPNDYIHYWWEGQTTGEDTIVRQIQIIGDDVNREGLKETPERVLRSWKRLYGGYNENSADILKVFDAHGCDQMVLLKDIELFSTCEHHMLPFFGKAHIAYIPDGKVIGVSKLARLLEIYARRLQIQERIGEQVTTDLMTLLKPKGAACVIEAQHFCMKARGVEKQNSVMVTSSLKGAFLDKPEARAELMGLIK